MFTLSIYMLFQNYFCYQQTSCPHYLGAICSTNRNNSTSFKKVEQSCSNPSCLFEPCCPRGYAEPSFRHSNHLACVSTSAKSGVQKTTWFKPSSLFVNFPKNDITLLSSQFFLKRQHGSNQVVYFQNFSKMTLRYSVLSFL